MLPFGGRPSALTACSTSSMPRSSRPARRTIIRRATSSAWAKTATRSRWRSPVSHRTKSTITAEQSVLTVEGRKAEKQQREFLYQGISSRPFKRQFNLADYVQVKGAAFDNGLLQIELVRELPEAMKPRRISIAGSSASNVRQIDGKAAA